MINICLMLCCLPPSPATQPKLGLAFCHNSVIQLVECVADLQYTMDLVKIDKNLDDSS